MKKQIYIPSWSILLEAESAYITSIQAEKESFFERTRYVFKFGDSNFQGKLGQTNTKEVLKLWKKIAYQIKKAREND